jgi:hypothetical protein
VQLYGLSSDRESSPGPTATDHPRVAKVSKCGFKIHAPRIRLQECNRTCDTEDVRSFTLQRVNFGAREQPWKTELEDTNHEKTLTVRKENLLQIERFF